MRRDWLRRLAPAFLALGLLLAWDASAQDSADKSYRYQRIDTHFTLRTDSTVSVEERVTFAFTGSFHSAWRTISLDRLGAITDIAVLDGATFQPLHLSSKRLDKTDPKNWGRYAVWRSEGVQNIEWYYEAEDASRTWILTYVIHGAIAFGQSQDRFYYDVFTDYKVPVDEAVATVTLPQALPAQEIIAAAYTTATPQIPAAYDDKTGMVAFEDSGFAPYDAFTIDVGFPSGLISRGAYWRDWLSLTWGYLTALLALFAAIVAMAVRWYVTEKRPKGKGTVIPQYEPPQALKPAVAEVVCTERLTNHGLAATVVDLAIRGYLTIKEDYGNSWLSRLGGKHYRLVRKRDFRSDQSLEDYEREYLGILFESGDAFSTREVQKRSNLEKQRLHRYIEEMKRHILSETELDSRAYETGPSREHRAYGIGIAVIMIYMFGVIMAAPDPGTALRQPFMAIASTVLAAFITWGFFRYEARLSHAGRILKEDWLGFKMYLETAERYRLQNLTPETFERFLPYAMVFRIEKSWAKAFESVHLPQPAWYAGTAGISGTSAGGGFSASAFSASFASSFTSAFASSGGGGAGGGGAGGGGGGGGGGAG